ncbi:MAG: hypothetical protein ACLR8Y_06355 [Alistipes indistinctus]
MRSTPFSGVKVTLRVADAGFAAQLQREVRHLDGGPALAVSPPSVPFSEFIAGQQMLIVSYNSWLHITRSRSALIPSFPSFMVVKPARAQVPGQSRTIIRTVRPARRMRSRSTVPSSPYRLTRVSVRQRT